MTVNITFLGGAGTVTGFGGTPTTSTGVSVEDFDATFATQEG